MTTLCGSPPLCNDPLPQLGDLHNYTVVGFSWIFCLLTYLLELFVNVRACKKVIHRQSEWLRHDLSGTKVLMTMSSMLIIGVTITAQLATVRIYRNTGIISTDWSLGQMIAVIV